MKGKSVIKIGGSLLFTEDEYMGILPLLTSCLTNSRGLYGIIGTIRYKMGFGISTGWYSP